MTCTWQRRILSPEYRVKGMTLFATAPFEASVATNARTGIHDQNRLSWFYAFGDDVWTEYRLPNTIPGLIDLEVILTKAAFLAGIRKLQQRPPFIEREDLQRTTKSFPRAILSGHRRSLPRAVARERSHLLQR